MASSKKIYQIPNILCRNVLIGHSTPVEVVLIRDNYIISASRLGKIKIWDLCTGDNIKTLKGHTGTINTLDYYDGKIYSGSNDNTIRIWDMETGNCLKIFQGHTAAVLSVSVSANIMASGSDDGTIRIWNVESEKVLHILSEHTRSVSGVKIVGNKLFSVSWDHFLRIWDLDSGDCLGAYEEHFDAISALDVSNQFIVTADQTGYINIWDRENLELLHHLKQHRLAVMGLKIDQNYLYSTSKDKTILIIDVFTGICVKKLEGHSDATVGIDKEANYIVSTSADKTIRIWDDFSLHSHYSIQAHDGIILGTKTQGNTLVSVGTDNVLKIWDVKKGSLIKTIELDKKSWVWGLAFDNDRILASSDKGIYTLYDLETGEKLQELKGHQGKVYRTMIRGNQAITSGWDNMARVWDLTTGQCTHILKGHTYAIYSSVISEDGDFITGSSDGTIRVWDSTGKEKRIINYHQDEIFHLEIEGETLVSASGDGICGVFNYKTGEILAEFDDHTDQVWTVLIHKGLVITGSADKTIKIWDLTTKECLDTLEGHTAGVKDLAISGDFLVSGAFESTIRIWDIRKYLDKKLGIDERITQDLDTLVAQIQVARTYDMVPSDLGDPGLIRILYGMKPLTPDTTYEHEKLVMVLKESAQTWHNLGRLGFAPWLSDIPRGIKAGSIPLEEGETLDIVIQEFMNGFRENGDLFWMGLLRRFGNKIESLLPDKWTFSLDFSGQGPNPMEGFEWHRLGAKLNKVELEEREETALVFRLTLRNVNEWILPLVKAFEIQVKDDRGDVSYMNFSNFLPDDEGNWFSIAMFKIDSGYKMEPNAILYFTDINVIYESLLAPSFQGTNILKQLSIIRRENADLNTKIDTLQQQFLLLSEEFATTDLGEVLPKTNMRMIQKTVLPGYQILNIYTSPKAKDIFKQIEKQYQEPAIGTLIIQIGEVFNKFLEYIQPKFILFTSVTSIAAAVMAILLYLQGIININLLERSLDIAGNNVPLFEIILYFTIYAVLILILVISIVSWFKYQLKKRKRFKR